MAGYTRQDTADNIANGKIIDADDLDSEFDAVESAFNSTTGHNHDGTTGEGARITAVGPAGDMTVTSTAIQPASDNALDLGTSSTEMKDGFFDGTLKTDELIVDETSTFTGAVTASAAVSVGTTLTVGGAATFNGNVTLGNAASDTVAITADVASHVLPSADDTYDLGAPASEWRNLYIDGTANIDALVANTVDVTGSLAASDGATLGTTDALTGGTADGLNVVGPSNGLLAKFGGNRTVYDRALQLNEFSVDGVNNVGFQFNAEGTGTFGELRFAVAGTDVVTISDDNFVGIGTTDPQVEFHITGSNPQVRLQPTSDVHQSRIEFCNAAGTVESRIMSGGALGSTIQLDGDVEVSAGDNLTIPETSELRFGNSDELIIERSGAGFSDIRNTTGNLSLRNLADDKDVIIQSDDGSGGTANYFVADGSTGETKLYYYGSPKITTQSSGVHISGGITTNDEVVANVVTYAANQNAPYMIAATTSYTGAATTSGTYGMQHRYKYDSGGSARVTVDSSIGGVATEIWALYGGTGNMDVYGSLDVSGSLSIVSANPSLELTDTSTGVDHEIDGNSTVGNMVIHTDINGEGSDPKLLIKVSGTTGITVKDTGDVDIAGDLSVGGAVTETSDERVKDNIVDANSQWSDIKDMRLCNYTMKDNGERHLGVIAQELQNVSPGLVKDISDEEDGSLLGVNKSGLMMKMLGALQEAMARIEELEAKAG